MSLGAEALPVQHFMLADIAGSLLAVIVFACAFFAPGYVLAYATNLFNFRRLRFTERSFFAVACSFMVTPVASYFTGRAGGLQAVCWVLVACALLCGLLLLLRSRGAWPTGDRRATTFVVCGWILFVLLMLIDFQVGRKLYFSVVMADQSYRIAFTEAVARSGVPPANPLYFSGTPSPMHYYYFWYILCASVMKLAHVTARQSFIASSIWGGLGLLVTTQLFTRYFFQWEARKRWLAMLLLVITGADLLPSVGNAILQPALNGDIEWWSVEPIDAWPDSLLWVPHHVASVICCLLVLLFVWRLREAGSRASRPAALTMAALGCASAFGLSVYVACGFALLMASWLVWTRLRRRPEGAGLWLPFVIAGGGSVILLIPFLRELVRTLPRAVHPAATAATSHIFTLSVRNMIDSELLTSLTVFAHLHQSHPMLLDQTMRLLLLLPGLALELGLYGAVLVLLLRAKKHRPEVWSPERDSALFLTVSGLLISLFISSAVITNNDFGYRVVMLPQFFLTLLTADVLGGWRFAEGSPFVLPTPWKRRLLAGLFCLGAAGSLYGALLLRAWLPLETPRPQNGFTALPDDAYQVRAAFAALHTVAPWDAVISFRAIGPELDRNSEVMTPSEFYQRMLVMDSARQLLNAEGKCAVHFGGDPSVCASIQTDTARLYGLPAPDAVWATNYCGRFGVHYLIISHRDPSWESSSGWPAQLPAVASEPGFKILTCSVQQ